MKCSSSKPQSLTPFLSGRLAGSVPPPYNHQPTFALSSDCTSFYFLGAEPQPDFKTADASLSLYNLTSNQIQVLHTYNYPYQGVIDAGFILGLVKNDLYVEMLDTQLPNPNGYYGLFHASASAFVRIARPNINYNLFSNWWKAGIEFQPIDPGSGTKLFSVSNAEAFVSNISPPQKSMTPESVMATTPSGVGFALVSRDQTHDVNGSDAYSIRYYDSYGQLQNSEIHQTNLKSTLMLQLNAVQTKNKFTHVGIFGFQGDTAVQQIFAVDPEGQNVKNFNNPSSILRPSISPNFYEFIGLPNGDLISKSGACSYLSGNCGPNLIPELPTFGQEYPSFDFKAGDLLIGLAANAYRFHPGSDGIYKLIATLQGGAWYFDQDGVSAFRAYTSAQLPSLKYSFSTHQTTAIANITYPQFFKGGFFQSSIDANGNGNLFVYTEASGQLVNVPNLPIVKSSFYLNQDLGNGRIFLAVDDYNLKTNQFIIVNVSTLKIENQSSLVGCYIGQLATTDLMYGTCYLGYPGAFQIYNIANGLFKPIDTVGFTNLVCEKRNIQDGTFCIGSQKGQTLLTAFNKEKNNFQILGSLNNQQVFNGIRDIANHFSAYLVSNGIAPQVYQGLYSDMSLAEPNWELHPIQE